MSKTILISFIIFLFIGRAYTQCTADFAVTLQKDSVYLEAVTTGENVHYLWHFGDGNGVSTMDSTILHIYASSGLYNITLYLFDSLANCYDSVTKQVLVQFNDSCKAGFTITRDTINTRTYTFVPDDYVPADSSQYHWSIQNTPAGNGILKYTFLDTGYYNVCLEVYASDSCYSKICKTVHIPVADSCNVDASFIPTLTGDTLNVMSIGNTFGLVHSWNFGDGNQLTGMNLDTVQHIYNTPGNYTLFHVLRDTLSQCTDSAWQYITIVNPDSCSVDFSVIQKTTGHLFGFINPGNSPVLSYTWKVNTVISSFADTLYKIFPESGTYTVCLTVVYKNGCVATVCKNVTEASDNLCNITAAFTDSVAVNNPLKVFFSGGQSSAPADYWWSFGDGNFTDNAVYNPVHTYMVAGTYLVQLIVVDTLANCADTVARYITVNALPDSLTSGGNYISSYPNPSADKNIKMNLALDRPEEIMITIYNSQGTVMLTRRKSGVAGNNSIELDVSGLKMGQYFIDIRHGNQRKRSVFLRL